MKKIANIFLALILSVFLLNCEDTYEPNLDYVTFESTSVEFGVAPDGPGSQDFRVFTTGVSGSERTFGIAVVADETDATGYTVPSTVTVPANSNVGTFTVTANGPDIDPDNGNKIVVEMTNSDGSLFGDPITINLKQVCPNPELIIKITFDSYPEEIYWLIEDSSMNVVAESLSPADWGAYAGLEDGITEKLCIPGGTYTFSIFDQFSDGICCTYGNGSYTLTHNGVVLHSSDGAYGGGEAIVITFP